MVAETADDLLMAGFHFAKKLLGNETICLSGVMGAGKTHFVKGCCKALGIDDSLVASPSFALIHHYVGRCPVAHIDLYRLNNEEEFDLIGGYELLGNMICFVEWPDLIRTHLPKPIIDVSITIQPHGERLVTIMEHL